MLVSCGLLVFASPESGAAGNEVPGLRIRGIGLDGLSENGSKTER